MKSSKGNFQAVVQTRTFVEIEKIHVQTTKGVFNVSGIEVTTFCGYYPIIKERLRLVNSIKFDDFYETALDIHHRELLDI